MSRQGVVPKPLPAHEPLSSTTRPSPPPPRLHLPVGSPPSAALSEPLSPKFPPSWELNAKEESGDEKHSTPQDEQTHKASDEIVRSLRAELDQARADANRQRERCKSMSRLFRRELSHFEEIKQKQERQIQKMEISMGSLGTRGGCAEDCENLQDLRKMQREFELMLVDVKLQLVDTMDKKVELEEANRKLNDQLSVSKRRGDKLKPRDPFKIVQAVLGNSGMKAGSRGSLKRNLSYKGTPESDVLFSRYAVVTNDTIDAIAESSADALAENFLTICTVMMKSLKLLTQRVSTNVHLQQRVCFARSLGSYDLVNLGAMEDNSDAQYFYSLLMAETRPVGFKMQVSSDLAVYHPFEPTILTHIRVEKIFQSKQRPMLVRLCSGKESSMVIFKKGDDLRSDVACISFFRMCNHIWNSDTQLLHSGLQAITYRICAFGRESGAIEFIPGCLSADQLKGFREYPESWLRNLVPTAAGGFMAAYVVGAKDRHYDNILITDEGELFHIDFSHLFGDAVNLDTADFAITKDIYDALGASGWLEFVATCIEAFAVLRKHQKMLIRFGCMIFSALYPPEQVSASIERSLMLHLPLGEAAAELERLIHAAPFSYRTRFKNLMHKHAQGISQREEVIDPEEDNSLISADRPIQSGEPPQSKRQSLVENVMESMKRISNR
eukprot:247013_1